MNKMLRQIGERLIKPALRALGAIPKQVASWLLRWLFRINSGSRVARPQGGFVLPTAALLIVILGLFAGSILFQTFSRTAEVAGSREKVRIDNVAEPAVERAKAKLEALFGDPRLPNGLPAERFLLAIMNNTDNVAPAGFVDVDVDLDGTANDVEFRPVPNSTPPADIYTLPDETRVDIDGQAGPDNAWTFQSDLDNDGNPETIAYSISLLTTNNAVGLDDDLEDKADNDVVRTGPINVGGFAEASAAAANCPLPALAPAQGWTPIGTGRFRKNFQVNVFVENGNPVNRSVSAFEFQQDRELLQGNAFGVWFRYDLLIHPGPQFNLNGAVHTDGNLVTFNNSLRFFLVSAPNSCIYTSEANAITLAETRGTDTNGDTQIAFQSQVLALSDGGSGSKTGGEEVVDLFPPTGGAPSTAASSDTTQILDRNSDSVLFAVDGLSQAAINLLLDPIRLYTRNELRSRGRNTGVDLTPLDGGDSIPAYDVADVRDTAFDSDSSANVGDRIFNDAEIRPFVDDTYRADDRWGPQPTYGRNGNIQIPDGQNGQSIADNPPLAGSVGELLALEAPLEEEEQIGLDGYWERRSYDQGARLIVGQRLELGNPFGWIVDGDGDGSYTNNRLPKSAAEIEANPDITEGDNIVPPLDRTYGDDPLNPPLDDDLTTGTNEAYIPPSQDGMNNRPNEFRQQRTLRDNLAAVQAGVYYHLGYDTDNNGDGDRDFPVACMALTAHPGTLITKNNSTTFNNVTFGANTYLDLDFFTGVGTNGWEFAPPGGVTNNAAFSNLIENANSPLRVALDNLASFAGDPQGAFPPTQEAFGVNARVHPYPQQTMWGDFSNLRRALGLVGGTQFDDLSIADQSTIHTASCLLGMLANTLNQRELAYDSILNLDGGNSAISADIRTLSRGVRNLVNRGCGDGALFDSALYGGTACANSVFSVADAAAWTDPNPSTDLGPASACPLGTDGPGFTPFCDEPEVIRTFVTTQRILDVLIAVGATVPASLNTPAEIDRIANFITGVSQVERDRTLGFVQGTASVDLANLTPAVTAGNSADISFIDSTPNNSDLLGLFAAPDGLSGDAAGDAVNVNLFSSCDPDIFGQVQDVDGNRNRSRAGLALLFCRGNAVLPRYPSLYYLLPTANHNQVGNIPAAVLPAATAAAVPQALQVPTGEPYVVDANIQTDNAGVTYRVVGDTPSVGNNDGVEDLAENSFGAIAIAPRTPGIACTTGAQGWCLPYRDDFFSPDNGNMTFNTAGTATPADDRVNATNQLSPSMPNRVLFDGTPFFPVFLDKGMMNGRQLMAVRVLNIDLDINRDNFSGNSTTNPSASNGESWLPDSGLIYAFREDSRREDGIARPALSACANCDEESELLVNLNCRMNPRNKVDPPVNNLSGVSTKPVDFVADPDRRPYGFRLTNGLRLGRVGTTKGMSFISDDPVYILGNLNAHTEEEFTQSLNISSFNNFYTRTQLNTSFARALTDQPNAANTDRWRPSEILSDAITFLSVDYCDGTIEAGLRRRDNDEIDGENCNDNSFWNMNIRGRNGNQARFLLEDNTFSSNNNNTLSSVPVQFDSNGRFFIDPNGGTAQLADYGTDAGDDYRSSSNNRDLNEADDTRVSVVVVSGLSPTRVDETYGGLHNFPRFNEDWGGEDLSIRGSLIQLNFSTYDTANLDSQDTFDFNNMVNGTSGSDFKFYTPPNRRWGYDPALQYVPAAPVVERLLAAGAPRSEIFQRVTASDPYVERLCEAIVPTPDSCS